MKRFMTWKNHLFPPFLSVIYLSFHTLFIDFSTAYYLLMFFAATFSLASFGYWINDSCDIEVDIVAGKRNMAAKFTLFQRIIIALFLLFLSVFFWVYSNANNAATYLFALEVFVLVIYAVPPFRFKGHPIIGPLCDAHYSHIIPVFITIEFFFPTSISNNIYLSILVYLLLLFKGGRNILLHQLEDRKGDLKSNLNTFPVKKGPLFTLNLINKVILPLEFFLIVLISFLLSKLALSLFVIFLILNFHSNNKFIISSYYQIRFKSLYLFNEFYEYWLPYLCVWLSSLSFIEKLILTVIHSILFNKSFNKIVNDIKNII